jgi:hypothetical protein
MVEATRTEALNLIENDIDLKSSPLLAQKLKNRNIILDFE